MNKCGESKYSLQLDQQYIFRILIVCDHFRASIGSSLE
jgi:hypothetical protein